MPFTKVASGKYKSPSGRTFTGKQVKAYYATNGFTKKKNKPKVIVNNKIKGFGQMNTKTNLIEVNKKKHKGDKAQLADTIKHELMHVKHPQMKEKQIQKKADIHSYAEQQRMVAKLRNKKSNYKGGAIKRKLKIKAGEKTEPGQFIRMANETKRETSNSPKSISKEKLSIMGLV